MLFESLKRILRAENAELVSERDLFSLGDEKTLRPEAFNLTLKRAMSIDVVLRVVRRVCFKAEARMKILSYRKEDLNIPPRAIILITSRGTRFKKFRNIVLVQGLRVSFTDLPN